MNDGFLIPLEHLSLQQMYVSIVPGATVRDTFTIYWSLARSRIPFICLGLEGTVEKTLSTFPSLSYRCTLVTLRRAVFLTSVHLSSVGDTFHIKVHLLKRL